MKITFQNPVYNKIFYNSKLLHQITTDPIPYRFVQKNLNKNAYISVGTMKITFRNPIENKIRCINRLPHQTTTNRIQYCFAQKT